jgi:hypothetical protein
MIETNFFILNDQEYDWFYLKSEELGVSVDYYLLEFCMIEEPRFHYDGNNWVEMTD